MKYNGSLAEAWLSQVNGALPGLTAAMKARGRKGLVLGASCIMLYSDQKWIPVTKRQTADLDIAVQFEETDLEEYTSLRDSLVSGGYKPDTEMMYRLHSPRKIPGSLAYVDLLIAPSRNCPPEMARGKMGVGPGFSFEGFEFAFQNSYQLDDTLLLPNVFGFWALKCAAYLDEPAKRVKDLADIIEVAAGLVRQGTHYDLESMWSLVKESDEAHAVKQALDHLARDTSTTWEIAYAERELLPRGFSREEIDETLGDEISELVAQLK